MTWIFNILRKVRDLWGYRHEPEHLRRLAELYWRILLIVAGILVLLATLYGAGKFREVLRGEAENPLKSSGGALPILVQKDLQAILEGFSARATQHEMFKKSPPKVTDPSR